MNHQLLTVDEVATLLKMKKSWVYRNADQLGAFRLRKYLRFSLDVVMERVARSARLQPEDMRVMLPDSGNTPKTAVGSLTQPAEIFRSK